MPPALSIQRSACVVRLNRSQQPSVSDQRRLRCAFGLNVRRVLRWLKLMLLPKRMSLPAKMPRFERLLAKARVIAGGAGRAAVRRARAARSMLACSRYLLVGRVGRRRAEELYDEVCSLISLAAQRGANLSRI